MGWGGGGKERLENEGRKGRAANLDAGSCKNSELQISWRSLRQKLWSPTLSRTFDYHFGGNRPLSVFGTEWSATVFDVACAV